MPRVRLFGSSREGPCDLASLRDLGIPIHEVAPFIFDLPREEMGALARVTTSYVEVRPRAYLGAIINDNEARRVWLGPKRERIQDAIGDASRLALSRYVSGDTLPAAHTLCVVALYGPDEDEVPTIVAVYSSNEEDWEEVL